MIETWVEISGYEGLYFISNYGNVKSAARLITVFNKGNYKSEEKILNQYTTDKGYLRITLLRNGVKKNYLVHRLVAEYFIPKDSIRDKVNHKDGNKKNNYVENLEWCNNSENTKHAYRLGLQKPKIGAKNKCSKKVAKIDSQGQIIKIYDFMTEAAKDNNSFVSNISNCCRGKRAKVRGYSYKVI